MIETVLSKTCAVSGHRVIENGFSVENLKETFVSVIKEGYDTFLIGMAIGFDTLCFKILTELKKEYPIKTVACVPCVGQSKYFNSKQKKEYNEMLDSADSIHVVQEKYDSLCMRRRNQFLVDNSSLLVCYFRHYGGGTHQTVKYATDKEKRIIFL